MKRTRVKRTSGKLALIILLAILHNVQSRKDIFFDLLDPYFKSNTTNNTFTSTVPAPNATSSTADFTRQITSVISTVTTTTTIRKQNPLVARGINKKILEQCQELPRGHLRNMCRKVARDSYIVEMKTPTDVSERVLELNPFKQTPTGDYNCLLSCPTEKDWFESGKESVRSMSPWGHCLNYDPNRIPRWMNKAHCLCDGCINPLTGVESLDLVSKPIKTKVPVVRKEPFIKSFDQCDNKACFESREEVIIGCHCLNPTRSQR